MYPYNFRCLIAAGAHTVADLVAEGLVMLAAADNDAENATIHVAVMRTGDRGRPKFLLYQSACRYVAIAFQGSTYCKALWCFSAHNQT